MNERQPTGAPIRRMIGMPMPMHSTYCGVQQPGMLRHQPLRPLTSTFLHSPSSKIPIDLWLGMDAYSPSVFMRLLLNDDTLYIVRPTSVLV